MINHIPRYRIGQKTEMEQKCQEKGRTTQYKVSKM